MYTQVPIIGVVGHKDSGKTAVTESVVRMLTRKGHRVATAKHVNQEGFSLDTKGKDTWRHSVAGANPVASVSDIETAVLIKDGVKKFSLDSLLGFTSEADFMMLEGFSWLVLSDEHVGKILCVRNMEEYEDYKEKAKGEILAFCSMRRLGKPVLRIDEDSETLVKQVLGFLRKKQRISKILDCLPGLDCRKCGHSSCEEMALAVYRKEMRLKDCVPLKLVSKLKTRITINGSELPIQPFVSEIIRNSILGMISSLKGVSIGGNEEVQVEITS
ncbi:MAG: molybdopterin-guanine dinucleotide biosynthesis protein B [Candidatus Bathyarchaeota archaeon]|nr:MAG: molybdopterin-guanine dinucleotide biosynthesis protein B [Candidatus Bathyarchaeota archaeon]